MHPRLTYRDGTNPREDRPLRLMPVANHQLPATFIQQARPFAQPLLNLLLNGSSQQPASPIPQDLGQQIPPDPRLYDLGHG
ncbi:hypothetical protein LBMAG52_43550 [Planctomycetia bacterium]|nr:hypothetical protein LBMAG52_43550 [Planctomycetia bacterium]